MKSVVILRDLLKTRPNRTVWTVFIMSLLVTQGIAYRIFSVVKENELLQVKQEANHIKNRLESSLNQSSNASRIIAFLIEQNLVDAYFETVAQKLVSQNRLVDALQLVKDDTVVKTYPLKGNEAVIGYPVLSDPVHRKEAMKAVQRDAFYFEGPLLLKQGDVGVIGRLPVYQDNRLWGFSAVIVRKATLLKALGINRSGTNDTYLYQLVKTSNGNSRDNLFFKHLEDYNTGIFHREHLELGDWDIYAKLKNPNYIDRALQFSFLGLLFSVLVAIFMWHLSVQPNRLKLLVARKTKALDALNQELRNRALELTVSNKELEQFAYIASHDLQEPLRTVSTFLTQIERKYSERLDEKGRQYIFFAVEGAKRMRSIILDVLEFSRVGKYTEKPKAIDLNLLLDEVCQLQQKNIKEKKAFVKYGVLPVIVTQRSPMLQVFQNLIGNALKYSREGVLPIIEITVERRGKMWLFSVKDNGIGIEKEYADKIFVIFQRLHSTNQYAGTGIGLAIVKKIIVSLGGEIWLESEPGKGSTFYFTLPAAGTLSGNHH